MNAYWGAYVSFGRAMDNMNGWRGVHGVGAQCSDPKTGDPTEYADGHGPKLMLFVFTIICAWYGMQNKNRA